MDAPHIILVSKMEDEFIDFIHPYFANIARVTSCVQELRKYLEIAGIPRYCFSALIQNQVLNFEFLNKVVNQYFCF